MKARDLMVPVNEYLRPDNTLKEAVNLMRTAKRDEERVGVKVLPVIDDKGVLVGVLSMGDILKAVFPAYMSMMDLGDFTWEGMVESLAAKVADRKISELMTKEVVTVRDDAALMECVDHMLKKCVKRLIVLDLKGSVVGTIYERDVFNVITKAMLDEDGKAVR